MVEVGCPHCDENVELEDDVFGLFDCPHCDEEFIFSVQRFNLQVRQKKQSQFGNMMHGVKKVTKPFAGYYRLGVLRDYNEEEKEQFTEEKTSFLEYVLLPILFIFLIPTILSSIGMKIIQLWKYKLGGHPGKMLTEVDHLYIHPDGRVIVPLNDLAPFRFNIEGEMRIETHYHEGWWSSVSILKGRKCYFSLGGTDVVLASSSTWSRTGLEEIYQFLGRFDLKESERLTARPIST